MDGSEREAPLLALLDCYWFDRSVLQRGPLALPGGGVVSGCSPAAEPPPFACEPARRPNSLSGEVARATSSDSALLTHRGPMLSPIPSGKPTSEEEEEEEEKEQHGGISAHGIGLAEGQGRRCRRGRATRGAGRRGRRSKSLSELEFEELKGFMDLGFTFSGAESDRRLLSLVPGLQRLGRRRQSQEDAGLGAEVEEDGDGGVGEAEPVPRRPYLSEAWEVVGLDERSWKRGNAYDHLLRNWRVPAAGEGVDMKGHLRSWAHAVASAVRC